MDLAIFDEPHHQSLELAAARALASGEITMAFILADRRCRIAPAPGAHCHVLRAEACYRLGDTTAAIADLEAALDIAPDDRAANRRMLAWATGERRREAAAALLAADRDADVLRRALAVLRRTGRAFAAIAALDDAVTGWAAWTGDVAPVLTIAGPDGGVTVRLMSDPDHPLATRTLSAAAIDVARPRCREPQSITLRLGKEIVFAMRAPANAAPAPIPALSGVGLASDSAPSGVTVMVPVHGDSAATKACLDSLLNALPPASQVRILVIDDASPDPRIRRYLARLARGGAIELMTNASNLGFVGTVNRALAQVSRGDVVLLNADTIVPPGFLDRLAAAARTAPDIGTVTPLTNNGEFVSFPVPNVPNPLPSVPEIEAIDRAADAANGGCVVELPSGIGFCLYVTRRCLDTVGGLSERVRRGYLEDADFCLRARDRGFRHVCATDVFVGHAGARSFGREKKTLASRNLKMLEQTFPHYPAECVAYMAADPLRPARAALAAALPPSAGVTVPVVRSARIAPTTRPARVRTRGPVRLGIVPVRTSAAELRHMREIARVLREADPPIEVAVLGETLDDLVLMRFGNVAVSGPVTAAELATLMPRYRLGAIAVGFGTPSEHPKIETVLRSGLPVAAIGTTFGTRRRGRDLAIDPAATPREAALAIGRWAGWL
jgi:O-antigen biosynthesis protein